MMLLRAILMTIDRVIYWYVALLYELILKLSETGIFRTAQMRDFSERIYFFLGLIMLFKVSISIVQYIINPDAVKDSKTGAGKVIKNVVIILLGIVLIPYIFEAAFSLQRVILRDNTIGNLILGMNYTEGANPDDNIYKAGKMMSFTTFTAFFKLDPDVLASANSSAELQDAAVSCSNKPFVNKSEGATELEWSEDCLRFKDDTLKPLITDDKKSAGTQYRSAYETKQLKYFEDSLYNMKVKSATTGKKAFLFDYSYLISTIAGAALLYILLVFCFDVAVRSVKLGFLQLIAPIPLIAKIDPQKGDKVFNDWVKECVSTYLSLFIRLAALYFAVFVLSIIDAGMFNVIDESQQSRDPFVFVFMIFGALLFAKDLPKLIEKITGIKLDGDGLKLGKKISSTPLLGNMLGNTARKVAGGLDSKMHGGKFKSGWQLAKEKDKGVLADMRRKRMEYLPYSGEKHKRKLDDAKKNIQGAADANKMDQQYKNGLKTAKKIASILKAGDLVDEKGRPLTEKEKISKAFSVLNGASQNKDYYSEIFKNEEFVNSKMNLDREDEILKSIRRKNEELKAHGKLTAKDVKDLETQEKKVDGLQKVHETMRNKYAEDARTEDNFKFAKYNEINPVTGDDYMTAQPTVRDNVRTAAFNTANSAVSYVGSGQIYADVGNLAQAVGNAVAQGVKNAGAAVATPILLGKDAFDGFKAGAESARIELAQDADNERIAQENEAFRNSPEYTNGPNSDHETIYHEYDQLFNSPEYSSFASQYSGTDSRFHNQDVQQINDNTQAQSQPIQPQQSNFDSAIEKLSADLSNAVQQGMEKSTDRMANAIGTQVGQHINDAFKNGVQFNQADMNKFSQMVGTQVGNNIPTQVVDNNSDDTTTHD